MISQLLGVIGLAALNGLAPLNQSNSVSGFRDYTNSYNYQVRFDISNLTDVFDLSSSTGNGTATQTEIYYGGLDYNYSGSFVYNQQSERDIDIDMFNTFDYFNYSNQSYMSEGGDVDLFIYTQYYKSYYSGTYSYTFTINFALGDNYKGTLNNISVYGFYTSSVNDKSTFGFPYDLNDVYNMAENEDSPNQWEKYFCPDTFSPYNLSNGYNGDEGQKQLYPYSYGYSLNFTSSSEYSVSQLNTLVGSFSVEVNTYLTTDDVQNMYQLGFDSGYQSGESIGYQKGYNEGLIEADHQSAIATSIFVGIINIALVPINFFLACLNFEVFGINISAFVTALMTVMIIIVIARVIFNGGNKK